MESKIRSIKRIVTVLDNDNKNNGWGLSSKEIKLIGFSDKTKNIKKEISLLKWLGVIKGITNFTLTDYAIEYIRYDSDERRKRKIERKIKRRRREKIINNIYKGE